MRIFTLIFLMLSGSLLLSACNNDNDDKGKGPDTVPSTCKVHCGP